MVNSVKRMTRYCFRKFNIVLSMVAVATILFLPVTHPVAMDISNADSMEMSCTGHETGHKGDHKGYSGGHCDMQSCSFCFPIPMFDHQITDQGSELKFVWSGTHVQFHKQSPPLRPPRFS